MAFASLLFAVFVLRSFFRSCFRQRNRRAQWDLKWNSGILLHSVSFVRRFINARQPNNVRFKRTVRTQHSSHPSNIISNNNRCRYSFIVKMFRVKIEEINPSRFGFRQIGFRRIVFYLNIVALRSARTLHPHTTVFGFTGILSIFIFFVCWDFVKQFHSDNNNNNNPHECVQQSKKIKKLHTIHMLSHHFDRFIYGTWFKHDSHFVSVAPYICVARISAWICIRSCSISFWLFYIRHFRFALTCRRICASFNVGCRMHYDIVW